MHTELRPSPLQLELELFGSFNSFEPQIPPKPTLPPSSPPLSSSGNRRIVLDGIVLLYTLLRSKRRSIGFLINEEGLRVTAPKWITLSEIEDSIAQKQRWILTKLRERQQREAQIAQSQQQWCDGATLLYLGSTITLRLTSAPTPSIHYAADEKELLIAMAGEFNASEVKEFVHKWLQEEAKRLFTLRLPIYAEKLAVNYRSLTLSSATTQWGSCTVDGKIRLNWRLIHCALPLIDYVIAHELSHRREMNHSPRFWATVQSVFPDFAAARKQLREQARNGMLGE